jgi:ribokinase
MVVGSSNTDMVVKTDHLPGPGETVMGGKFVMVPGGKGANQAVAAARLGGRVVFVARLGTDVFGDKALENFRGEGMETRYIVRDPDEPSGVALIYVDARGENEIVVAPGANRGLSPEDVDRAAESLSGCTSVVLQLETPLETVEHAARLAHEKGVKVILNPAPMCPDGLPKSLLELVDILVPNESETRMLIGLPADRVIDAEMAGMVLDLGVKQVVVTLGSRGAIIAGPGGVERIPSPKVQAVDTTAAGDAFTGALAVALGSGMDIVQACQLAAKAASLSVTRIGAQSSLPTVDELSRFFPAELAKA